MYIRNYIWKGIKPFLPNGSKERISYLFRDMENIYNNKTVDRVKYQFNDLVLDKDYSICELGMGTGFNLNYLKSLGFGNLSGVEFTGEGIRVCKKCYPFVNVFSGNVFDIDFPVFDVVFSHMFFHLVDDRVFDVVNNHTSCFFGCFERLDRIGHLDFSLLDVDFVLVSDSVFDYKDNGCSYICRWYKKKYDNLR